MTIDDLSTKIDAHGKTLDALTNLVDSNAKVLDAHGKTFDILIKHEDLHKKQFDAQGAKLEAITANFQQFQKQNAIDHAEVKTFLEKHSTILEGIKNMMLKTTM